MTKSSFVAKLTFKNRSIAAKTYFCFFCWFQIVYTIGKTGGPNVFRFFLGILLKTSTNFVPNIKWILGNYFTYFPWNHEKTLVLINWKLSQGN